MKVGVVCGFPHEAACLDRLIRKPHEFNTSTGIGPERAERAACTFVDAGAGALLSFGIAGGLSALVPAGTIVLATTVVDGKYTHVADKAWLSRLELAILGQCPFVKGPLAGMNELVQSPENKQELGRLTAAFACDMESHAVARVAASHNLPFAAIRAISDPHDRYVPDWVIRCLTPAGEIQIGMVLRQAIRKPSSVLELIGLSRDAKKGFNSLRRVALRLGPSLCY